MSTIQSEHFRVASHRYDENLLVNPPLHVADETRRIVTFLTEKRAQTVIDFGCGNGRLTLPLLQAGFRVTAVDISAESLERLRAIAKKLHCHSRLTTSTQLPRGQFDAVVGADILHHVPIEEAVSKMNPALRKGGIILFSEPNILNLSWTLFITLFLDWRVERGIIHCNYFSLNSVVRKNGFEGISIDGFALAPPVFFNGVPVFQRVNYYLGSLPLIRFFAYRMFVSAVKP